LQHIPHGLEVVSLNFQIRHLAISLGGRDPVVTQKILDGLHLDVGI
jgi:hypothetical protein